MPVEQQGSQDQPQPTVGEDSQFTPITSQEQLNAILGERLARERSKFRDYAELKSKAEKYDQAEAASKSDLQKAQEENAALVSKIQELEIANLRTQVASEKGLPPGASDFLTGANREELEISATRLLGMLHPQPESQPGPQAAPGLGQQPPNHPGGDEREAVRRLFQN